jgi:hypothetical protein
MAEIPVVDQLQKTASSKTGLIALIAFGVLLLAVEVKTGALSKAYVVGPWLTKRAA